VAEILRTSQQKFFSKLKNAGINIKTGFLLKQNNRYSEKGVDVRIAIDLLIGAFRDTYDEAFIVSSDTDLLPAIKESRLLNKRIIYVGFTSNYSRAMVKNCSGYILFSKHQLLSYSKQ
jgi:uncharacterized LabA/DUF88 family protein